MTERRFSPARWIAPFVLAGMLVSTGCSTNSAPAADAPAEAAESTAAAGTGVTSIDDLNWGSIDSPDAEFNEAMEALALALNAEAAPGLHEININAHGPSLVGINLLTDSEDGTITDAQLRNALAVLETFRPPSEVRKYQLGGFNRNFGSGEILTAGAAIGVNPEFLDEISTKVEIPGDQLSNLYA